MQYEVKEEWKEAWLRESRGAIRSSLPRWILCVPNGEMVVFNLAEAELAFVLFIWEFAERQREERRRVRACNGE